MSYRDLYLYLSLLLGAGLLPGAEIEQLNLREADRRIGSHTKVVMLLADGHLVATHWRGVSVVGDGKVRFGEWRERTLGCRLHPKMRPALAIA